MSHQHRYDGKVSIGRLVSAGNGADPSAAFMGAGTATAPFTNDAANTHFIEHRFDNGASTGTARGQYTRLYLTGGAGGEAIRAYTTNSSNTPADTVNGAHISLSHGSSAGNVTGLGTACRCTYHVPSRSLTGTNAAVMAELYADGASSTSGGTTSLIRFSIGGNATGKALLETTGYLMDLDIATQTGGIFDSQASWSVSKVLKIKVGGVDYYLPLSTAK